MDALGSPILLAIIIPPLMIISGFAPNNAGFHKTISAIFPGSIEPTYSLIPWVMVGLIGYLATYLFTRKLLLPFALSSGKKPLCFFILSAVCHVRVITSATRPIAWLSELIILNTPMS